MKHFKSGKFGLFNASASFLGVVGVLVLAFQNCSAPVQFTATPLPSQAEAGLGNVSLPDDIQPQYSVLKAGDEESFPPLKLVFMVDNSGTMEVNQINLSDAFAAMFSGDNEQNLAKFDTTAFVFNTAQLSQPKTSSVFNKLPQSSQESFTVMPLASIVNDHRSNHIDGVIPGDLVGYQVDLSQSPDQISFYPAAVAGFEPAGASSVLNVGIHKTKNGSVAGFAQEFRDRIALLNPARSAIDSSTHQGILDPVVDKESGLCGLARVLKNNHQFLNPGDLAAFIVVSDENDADPVGVSCVDKYLETNGQDDLVDGRCEQAYTTMKYYAPIENPSAPKCAVDYNYGFKYKYVYNQPTTELVYYVMWQHFSRRQTQVDYYSMSHRYTKAQTKVKYFKELKSCETRDGIEMNCTYSYPSFESVLSGRPSGTCAAFAAGRLPTGALYSDASHPLNCVDASVANLVAAGSCPTGDPSVTNCSLEYAARQMLFTLNPPADCAAFVAGKLGSDAVYSTSGGYAPQCSEGPLLTNQTSPGFCSNADSNIVNCQNAVSTGTYKKTLDGEVANGQTCSEFAQGRLESNAIYDEGVAPISCTTGAVKSVSVTGTEKYATPSWNTYDPQVGDVCSQDLVDAIRTSKNLVSPTSCVITAFAKSRYNYEDTQCASIAWENVCVNSNGAKRECVSTDIPRGSAFETTLTTKSEKGVFSCNTSCANTSFCSAKPGTVGENYNSCSTQSGPTSVTKTFNAVKASEVNTCRGGEKKVVTKGPYRSRETASQYVAGELTLRGDTNALATYVKSRSQEIFGQTLPSVAVFVRQPGDSLGTNGSIGTAYNTFAELMGGEKKSVFSNADGYAASLHSLGTVIGEKLGRSFSDKNIKTTQSIHRVWHRKAGAVEWGQPLDQSLWSASGGTLTLDEGFEFESGDEFKIEFY